MKTEAIQEAVENVSECCALDFDAQEMARGLGWFSIALGAAELFAADSLARWLGTENRTGLLRVFGLREIGAGIGILSQKHRVTAPWLWARVAGDALDIAALAAALADKRTNRGAVEIALAAVLGATAADIVCAQKLPE